ncbi:glycosyltransferase family 2 protein [Dyadobacter sp. CY326]|uniref:glycosyltransferase family 2 protein n=1 Tax=Dyadobacter sp. CY326 TaxID=2907300 RepID=UPI001F35FF0A|nr:glycosyltransferase family 2 protein [Dyadobacter sp. CY326]MCE7065377.1 glycosyltransferase [Dyadobacter sp. CY326]
MTDPRAPLISIITVTYNAAATLEYTIKSVVEQTYSNIEFVVIDGASTDGTLEILRNYRSNLSVFVSEKDSGIYDAMNKALGYAKGDWVYFLGADDVIMTPSTIEDMVQHFNEADTIYYGDIYLKSSKRLYNGRVNLYKLLLCNISHQAIFYPKSVYKEKEYQTKYKYFADHVYNLELYASSKNSFKYISKVIAVYNDQGSSSTNVDEQYNADIIDIIKNNFGSLPSAYLWARREIAGVKKKMRH